MDTDKWYDISELTYKDDFDLIFQRQGWHQFSCKPLYNDPNVIKQHWINPPQTDKRYSPQGFLQLFGDSTFRKLLSIIFSGPRTTGDLEHHYGGKKLDGYLAYMNEQEIVVFENDHWKKAPQYAHLHDIGTTLEWYVAEWFRSVLKTPARHGVHVEGMPEGGDLDVVAFVNDLRIMVECKSGKPSNITEEQLELFLRRAAGFNPDIALLLIDTDQKIDTQIEMIKKIYLESDLVGPRSSRAWNTSCVHVRNVKNSIDRSLRDALHSHSTNNYDDRPLVELPTMPAQLENKRASNHIAALHRRLELRLNRPSLEQTKATWIERVGTENYRFLQEVFSGDNPTEVGHLTNCKILVQKGDLRSEDDNGVALGPFFWDRTKRYGTTF